ncbi:hypothetical protein SNEBB_005600 [Seison nebaliae]|nr:hypothetical protein SNEBB_005600 [Seison nebaliae]
MAQGKVYVGNLAPDAKKDELERIFEEYGQLTNVWVARNPPGFAFVEFKNARDAEEAVNRLDGKVLCGTRVRIELSHGRTRRKYYRSPEKSLNYYDDHSNSYQPQHYRRSRQSPQYRSMRNRSPRGKPSYEHYGDQNRRRHRS